MEQMRITKNLSVIIPALNEEKNICQAVQSVQGAIAGIVDDYEIIIVNDGSSDKTGLLAEEVARSDARVKVFHNKTNQGYGYCYRKGVSLAQKTYVSVFPGDNDMSGETLRALVQRAGAADVIFTNEKTAEKRSLLRRILSRCFVVLINSISGLKLNYYTGAFLCKTSLARSITLESDGLAIGAECLVKLLKSGCSYATIALEHSGRKQGSSKALTLRSLISVIKTIIVVVKASSSSKNKFCLNAKE